MLSATIQNAQIVHSTTLCELSVGHAHQRDLASFRHSSVVDHRFHCRPNRTVKSLAFLSSLGIKIRHVSFLFLQTHLATNTPIYL